jgi:hypothetical protein
MRDAGHREPPLPQGYGRKHAIKERKFPQTASMGAKRSAGRVFRCRRRTVEMKERFFESFAILLAGLFSAERPKAWQLGDAPRAANQDETAERDATRSKN